MIDLETKYLPYAVVRDEATREAAMLLAPTIYFDRELRPTIAGRDDDELWGIARRWACAVEGVGDFLVLMELCGDLVRRDTGRVARAEDFLRRLAAGPLLHPSYLRVVERDLPGCLDAAPLSWRQVGAWVLYALSDEGLGAEAFRVQLEAREALVSGRELEREVVRRAKSVSDAREFAAYVELLARAFSDPDSFVENRGLWSYVPSLAPAMTPTYPHGLEPGDRYPGFTWSHLAMWLGQATRMD